MKYKYDLFGHWWPISGYSGRCSVHVLFAEDENRNDNGTLILDRHPLFLLNLYDFSVKVSAYVAKIHVP